jgi:chemotaxis protein MotB
LNKNISAKDTQISSISNDLAEIEKQRLAEVTAVVALQERLKSAQDELTSLQTDVAEKQNELDQTKTALSDEEKLRLIEMAATKELRERLKNSQDELTAMTLALEEKRKDAENTLTLLAAAQAAKIAAVDLADERLSDREKEAALLAQANNLLKDEQALSAESQRKVALLNQQTNVLRGQLDTLQGLLDDANAKDLKSKIQIESLGTNLNTALARVAAEQKNRAALEEAERKRLEAEAVDLKKFRSDFFGRLREVLGTQEGVRIVGDRFVFSSEILYGTGSAELGVRGKEEIRKVAKIIKDIADQIPEEIDWILRVDGHTDNTPIRGFGGYKDNWELSQARALAVVKYLINDLGIPANRLSANGFGEFQPIAEGDSPEALAANRRIELKLTEK